MKKRPKRGNPLRFRKVDSGAGNESGDAGGWMRGVRRLKPALMDILDSAIAICGADFGNIQLLDPESGDLRIVAQRGFPKWWLEFWGRVAKGKGTRGTALERGRRMIVEDVKRNPAFLGKRAQAMQLKAGVRAVQSTPLATRTGKHLGMFSTHYRLPGGPDERAVRLLDLLARQASDVIEREQAEEALRRSEERLRLAQQAARSGTFEWNLQTGVNTWSPGLERLYGLRSGEFSRTQLAWEQLVHPDDRPEALRRVEQAFRTGKPTEAEWRVVWPDGSVHWLAGRWQVFKDRAGRPVRMAGVNFDITARKETEAALQRSEALYRAIGESIDYGVWVCAPDGRNTYASESFLKMVGITQAQCSNFGWGSVLHPEDAKRTIAAWKRCVRTGGKWDIEHRFRGADGQWHHVLARGVPVRSERGEIVCWAGINLDISRLKQVQESLRASEERFRIITSSTPDHVMVQDRELRYVVVVNPQLGLSEKDMLGKRDVDFLRRRDAAKLTAIKRRVLRTGRAARVELPLASRGGTSEFFEGTYVPKRDAQGRIDALIGYFRNVTERKRVEAALAKEREELQLILDSSPALIFYKDRDNRFVRVNRAFAQSMGRSREELEGRSMFELYPRAQAEAYWRDDQEVIRSGKPKVNIVEPMQTATGERWVRTDKVASRDAAGKITGIIGFAVDITERKRAEARLQQLNATLEQRVTERTAELSDAHDRLRAIMDNALVGILTLDERGLVQTVNPAVTTIFGYSPAETVGHSINRLMAGAGQAAGEEFLEHYTQAGEPGIMGAGREVLGRRKDGELIPVELTVSDFRHAGRRQFVAMVRDTSERRRLERELLEIGERERQRLGHDLHDGLGQHLHALYYLATLLGDKMKGGPPEQSREIRRLAQQLEHGLELTRSLARGLQPVNAVPEGLMVALRELAARTRELYRVGCDFVCRKAALIHRHSAANHLYRIAQEALNNAVRHGKPKRIQIRLTATPQQVVLGVRDDGVGMRRRAGRPAGMGLRVMQYRANAVGGSLAVRRHPRGGTEVVCQVTRQALLEQPEKRQ